MIYNARLSSFFGLLVTSGKGISGQWRKFEYSEHQLATPRFATKQFIAFALAGSIFSVVAGYVLVKYPYEYLGVAILVLVVVIVALLFHAMLITRRSRIGFAEQQMNPNPRDKDKSAVAVSIAENE